ncbi:M23 family metallopeptidase [Hymenobacter taeanensis]|uniref:M23 family metallopeptidase n=1 Tax=Hymenobacter taeanensis TaxID=2735321 RepID=A0A6M6BLZ4_9BACT|nr:MULTISPECIES: M23 family metallopeptidase [Hymenobacter]QJX48997.1 M23 family metallopeptidase [Hymenobacter taeanensis]UOQ81488.1 M23 family metallopeptidase [Hymenobacter sp. 5414T-23]
MLYSFLKTQPRLLSLALPFLVLLGMQPTSCGGQEPDSSARPQPASTTPPDAKVAVPNGYFLFPIKPGQPNYLAASMGELRPNHFHGGLDIKTDGRVDLPVYASADGYVSRMKQSSYGYGNVLYITHPNGLTTVYGHLNHFRGPVAQELRRQQYAKQTYELELFFKPDQFPVKRGELVALSGNTGGSAGPHVHWEVRTAQDHQLNPLQWGGFPEIQDHVRPILQAFGVEALSIDARVQGKFGKQVFVPKAPALPNGGGYVWPDTITAYGTVGLLLQGFDRFDVVWNKYGFQKVDVLVNNEPLYSHVIDDIPFPEGARQINRHTDYEWRFTNGRLLEKLFVDDGNDLSMYTTGPRKGRLRVQDGQLYNVEVRMSDSYGNMTPLRFVLRGKQPSYTKTRSAAVKTPALRYDVSRNLLVATAADPDTAAVGGNLTLYKGDRRLTLKPSYTEQSQNVYLYDLRAGRPDSMQFGRVTKRFERQALIPSGRDFSFTTANMSLGFGPKTLFDTLYIQTSYKAGLWTVHLPRTPLYQTLRMTLKPEVEVADKPRSAIYSVAANGGKAYVGGKWDGNNITANIKTFGQFRILTDTIPPSARLVSKGAGGLVFKVGDDLSGLAGYKLEIGGQFRMLRFEHKNATLFTERDDQLGPPLRGPATLRITDQAGNEKVLSFTL